MGKSATHNVEVNRTMISPRQIPDLPYTVQNLFISAATILTATASFLLTAFVILPLAILRMFIPKSILATGATTPKVILVIGASRGIGKKVMKQYANEADTVIIAVSSSIEDTRNAVIDLGQTKAIVQCSELDLTENPKEIADKIKHLDRTYGPITHMFSVSGISNTLKDSSPWNLDTTTAMINVNVTGTAASIIAMYELMKHRGYGKICVVGSAAGHYGPANMITYSATKSFVNIFASSLRVLGAPCGVEVVTVEPGFIDTRMTKKMRKQGSIVPGFEFRNPEDLAKRMKYAVEHGGIGVVSWPSRQGVIMHGLRGLNPICEEIGRWVSMKMGVVGKKIS